jgi:D-glycero-D-manno-heptose 1,7-bisphosphate phosphatase
MRLIILDRDGVINQDSDDYIKSPDEYIPLPGSLEAIARLNQAGFLVAVATNQSGLGRGMYDRDTLDAIHAKLGECLAQVGGHIDAIFYCPHTPEDHCDCRKPAPGLLQQISEHFALPLTGVPFVGDALRDLQAARAVGASPILVRTGKGMRTLEKGEALEGVPVFDNLAAVVDSLLAEN